MPSGPKRKFNSYEEHFGTMAPRPPSRRAPRQQPAPTPETQELYNKMRREEEKPSFEFLRQQSGLGGFLQPPSPSIATATSPSPSSASATHSVTRAMNDMSVGGDQPRPKKPRAGRHGPLREATKHRAALMRKLGACEECRERRVKCSHFDPALFEAAYQEGKQAADQPLDPDPEVRNPSATPYQPRFSDSLSLDLIGVGVGQENYTSLPFHGFQGGRDEVHDDPLSEYNQNQHTAIAPNPPSSYIFGDSRPAIPTLIPPCSAGIMPQNSPGANSILIGKQVAVRGQEWDCLWGSNDPGSSTSSGEVEPCNRRFRTLEELKKHFAAFHTPFDEPPWYMWRCIRCAFHWRDKNGPCIHCSGDTLRQKCCWASRTVSSGSTSGPLGRVASEDGSPSNRSAWSNPSAQYFGQTGGYNPPFFTFGDYGNGGGAGQYYNAVQATAPESAQQSKACCLRASASARQSYQQTSYPDGITRTDLISHAHSAFPWFAAVSLLTIALIESCRFVSRACAGLHITSCIINNSRFSIPELSIVCVVVGLFAAWLFRHAMFRLTQHAERLDAQRHERCYMRDIFGITQIEGDGRVAVVAG